MDVKTRNHQTTLISRAARAALCGFITAALMLVAGTFPAGAIAGKGQTIHVRVQNDLGIPISNVNVDYYADAKPKDGNDWNLTLRRESFTKDYGTATFKRYADATYPFSVNEIREKFVAYRDIEPRTDGAGFNNCLGNADPGDGRVEVTNLDMDKGEIVITIASFEMSRKAPINPSLDRFESALIGVINEYRNSRGIKPLRHSEMLSYSAAQYLHYASAYYRENGKPIIHCLAGNSHAVGADLGWPGSSGEMATAGITPRKAAMNWITSTRGHAKALANARDFIGVARYKNVWTIYLGDKWYDTYDKYLRLTDNTGDLSAADISVNECVGGVHDFVCRMSSNGVGRTGKQKTCQNRKIAPSKAFRGNGLRGAVKLRLNTCLKKGGSIAVFIKNKRNKWTRARASISRRQGGLIRLVRFKSSSSKTSIRKVKVVLRHKSIKNGKATRIIRVKPAR